MVEILLIEAVPKLLKHASKMASKALASAEQPTEAHVGPNESYLRDGTSEDGAEPTAEETLAPETTTPRKIDSSPQTDWMTA